MPPNKKFNFKQNALCTFLIILFVWALGLVLESLGQVMTILGATTNSGIGFLIPIVFYLRVLSEEEDDPTSFGTTEKIKNKKMIYLSYACFGIVCVQSIIGMVTFVEGVTNKK